jgi:post-segregation antitoxin (ccd killing protein)
MMRDPLFEPKAAKQTVSITLNSDLYAKAKSSGINASKVAEEALASKYAEVRSAELIAELKQGLAAVESYADQHGSFSELVREHYEREDGPV